MRCFVALGLADGPEAALEPWLESTRANFTELAVSRATNLHLTLAFLGEIGEESLELASAEVRAAARRGRAWPLRWTSPGVFPPKGTPRVLWLGADGGEALAHTHEELSTGLKAAGLVTGVRAFRPFRPHLTLARVRRREISRDRYREIVAHLETLPTPEPSTAVALVLYQSRLGGDAAVHTPLLTSPLDD